MLVIIYAPPNVRAFELAAVSDVFHTANECAPAPPHYDARIVADKAGPLRASTGLILLPDMAFDEAGEAELLVVLSSGSHGGPPPPERLAWLRRQANGAARFGSIGNGAFLLGAAGLLDGRRVATHWNCADELAADFPAARVEPDRIFLRDGALFSAAGGVAAIDLMLDLIEEDHGRELALELAHRQIMFMKRSGSQAQMSVQLATQATTRDSIQRAQQHVRDHVTGNLSVSALAAVAAMSPRNFARVFLNETRVRPADYVERVRVNLAMHMLEESALPAQQVAKLCGFPSTEAARRAFRRRLGITLTAYRAGLGARSRAR